MLKLISELEGGVYHCKENLDIVKDEMKNKAMNHFQTIIFQSFPVTLFTSVVTNELWMSLHVMLRRHIDNTVKLCNKQYASGPKESELVAINSKGAEFYNARGYEDQAGSLDHKVLDIDWHSGHQQLGRDRMIWTIWRVADSISITKG